MARLSRSPSIARWLLAAVLLSSGLACRNEPPPPPIAVAPPPAPEPEQERQAFPEAPLPPPPTPTEAPKPRELPVALGDLAEMKKRGVLRVLVERADEEFLPRQGMPREQDRVMLERFAQRHGLKAEFILVERFDTLIPWLREGRADLIAAGLTVTKAREQLIAFTRPVAAVSEYVVGRRGAPDSPRTPEALAGRTVHVRESSSFAESLRALAEKRAPGLVIEPVPESVEPEALAYDVSQGTRPLTVLDSHLLSAIEAYNPDVERLFSIADGRQIAWGVRQGSPALKAALDGFIAEQALTEYTAERFTGDLDGVRKRGALRVLTRNNPVTYFLHRGEPHGFDYQLARAAAEALGVRLEMVVAPSRDALIPWLREGRADVIAASLTVTPEREAEVAFSRPYLFVDEVLVQRAGAPKLTSLADLRGQKVHVRASSSYHQTLLGLREKYGPFEVVLESEEQEDEVLVARVGAGELPLTVMDSHMLGAELTYRDDIQAAFPLTESGPDGKPSAQHAIAFAVRQESPKLRAFLDGFVKKTYRGTHYNMWRKRYFENGRTVASAKEERVGEGGRLSPYDGLIQSYSARYGLDWRLMAAQAYQESRFDPKARSWVGAQGLFQVMPSTGRSLGFTKLDDPEQGTHAGILYMYQMIGQVEPSIPFKHRLRFALAAYNAGLGHVLDARRLAREQGWNPDKWFGHVEKAMLLLEKPQYYRRARHGYCRGSEPVKYVSEIQTRYGQYVEALPH